MVSFLGHLIWGRTGTPNSVGQRVTVNGCWPCISQKGLWFLGRLVSISVGSPGQKVPRRSESRRAICSQEGLSSLAQCAGHGAERGPRTTFLGGGFEAKGASTCRWILQGNEDCGINRKHNWASRVFGPSLLCLLTKLSVESSAHSTTVYTK